MQMVTRVCLCIALGLDIVAEALVLYANVDRMFLLAACFYLFLTVVVGILVNVVGLIVALVGTRWWASVAFILHVVAYVGLFFLLPNGDFVVD